ncbi:ficolin-2-like isoform X3 [Mytilus edulis]|uniref:ficolin-2-like isoform X3 n=1 Tax=Mytilus edulis TaxID=6550 RepID=UPI0039F088E2
MGSSCTNKKSFNSTCTSNDECETFRCIDSTCVCTSTSEYWSGSQCLRGIECADLPITKDGIYTIYPRGVNQPIRVFCVVRQNEKWTVIQRRQNGSVDFYRTWNEYKHGFGSAYGEYWLGNYNIHLISTNGRHELSIYMETAGGEHHTANYTTFEISDDQSLYVLLATGYSGDAGYDCLDNHNDIVKANGKPFTTKDRDNDKYNGNYAVLLKSAWWYSSNYYSDLNKAYNKNSGKMYWAALSGGVSKSIMMIKRIH